MFKFFKLFIGKWSKNENISLKRIINEVFFVKIKFLIDSIKRSQILRLSMYFWKISFWWRRIKRTYSKIAKFATFKEFYIFKTSKIIKHLTTNQKIYYIAELKITKKCFFAHFNFYYSIFSIIAAATYGFKFF